MLDNVKNKTQVLQEVIDQISRKLKKKEKDLFEAYIQRYYSTASLTDLLEQASWSQIGEAAYQTVAQVMPNVSLPDTSLSSTGLLSHSLFNTLWNAASATETNIEDRTFEYQNQLEARYGSLRPGPSVIAPK